MSSVAILALALLAAVGIELLRFLLGVIRDDIAERRKNRGL